MYGHGPAALYSVSARGFTRKGSRCHALMHPLLVNMRLILAPIFRPLRPADILLQVGKVDELIGLAAKLVGNHGRLRRERRHHADAFALMLQRLHEGAEIAVSGEQHDMIEMVGELHCIDGKLDIHVALDLAPPGSVGELFGWLRNH